MLTGAALFVLGIWHFWTEGPSSTALVLGGIAILVLVLGCIGKELPQPGEVAGMVNFISNPGRAIVDAATDSAKEWLADGDEKKRALLNPTETLAKYLEIRLDDLQDEPQPAPRPTGFGRKGLRSPDR